MKYKNVIEYEKEVITISSIIQTLKEDLISLLKINEIKEQISSIQQTIKEITISIQKTLTKYDL